jgi:hypothetical protein
VNRGAKILLRLRPHQSPDTFYDQDQLVLVMLHEVSLRHNPKPCTLILSAAIAHA